MASRLPAVIEVRIVLIIPSTSNRRRIRRELLTPRAEILGEPGRRYNSTHRDAEGGTTWRAGGKRRKHAAARLERRRPERTQRADPHRLRRTPPPGSPLFGARTPRPHA